MFQPYSAASLRQVHAGQLGDAADGGALAEPRQYADDDSLSVQCAKLWVDEVMIPSVRTHRDSLVREASLCLTDPEDYKKILVCTDGEQAPLYAVLENQVATCREDSIYFGKISAGHSGNCAVPDVCGGFPVIHRQYRERMSTVTDAEMMDIATRFRGVEKAIKIIDLSHMDAQSKSTFRKAIYLSHEIVMGAITPKVVNDGHRAAGLHPFDRNKLMGKMYPLFKTLTSSDTSHINNLMDGQMTVIGRRHGWIKSSIIQQLVNAKRDTGIKFPPISPNFDMFVINRQGAMNLSHVEILEMHQARIEERHQEVAHRQQRQLSNEDENRLLLFRASHCEASRSFDSTQLINKFKCKCGGKWSNGLSGFKSHEKNGKHTRKYPPDDWDRLYPLHPVNAGDGEAPGMP
jgi:hypothetical protein